MAKKYTININNGQGTENILNDTYNVTAESIGYVNSSITPTTVTIVDGTNDYIFTMAAEGTLTLHVTETGEETGVPISGATFYRTDADGNTYGNPITTNEQGNAIFANVPYATTGAPNIYFKQTTSDGNHNFNSEVVTITLTSQTNTEQITNPLPSPKTIKLTDINYNNLPIATSTITLQ